jgi:hypothetical protein
MFWVMKRRSKETPPEPPAPPPHRIEPTNPPSPLDEIRERARLASQQAFVLQPSPPARLRVAETYHPGPAEIAPLPRMRTK